MKSLRFLTILNSLILASTLLLMTPSLGLSIHETLETAEFDFVNELQPMSTVASFQLSKKTTTEKMQPSMIGADLFSRPVFISVEVTTQYFSVIDLCSLEIRLLKSRAPPLA